MHTNQMPLDWSGPVPGAYFPSVIEAHEGEPACQTAPTAPVRARRTDPETSHTAAANAEKFAASHAGRILAAVEKLGTATAHEIAVATGLSVVQVDRRRKEMETAGLVYMLRQGGKLFTRDGFMVWAKVGA